MRSHLAVALFLATTTPCASQAWPGEWGQPIPRPLTESLLTANAFLVVTDLWADAYATPDTLRFNVDGTVHNLRAGLTGSWRLVDDTTVRVGTRIFRHRAGSMDLYSPVTPAATLGWRVRLALSGPALRDTRMDSTSP
jgi:hypothetical protein